MWIGNRIEKLGIVLIVGIEIHVFSLVTGTVYLQTIYFKDMKLCQLSLVSSDFFGRCKRTSVAKF